MAHQCWYHPKHTNKARTTATEPIRTLTATATRTNIHANTTMHCMLAVAGEILCDQDEAHWSLRGWICWQVLYSHKCI